mmetsp:Transcript_43936/g.71442  ORF Transcript_43936/g.71442 Transcript_43936/m.71442 type:complete len:206 (-) Transcript_43936:39-656(-)
MNLGTVQYPTPIQHSYLLTSFAFWKRIPQLLQELGAEAFYLEQDDDNHDDSAGFVFGKSVETAAEAGEEIKKLGNENFKNQDYKYGIQKYQQALRYLNWCEATGTATAAINNIVAQCYNNMAACELKLDKNRNAVEACDKLLEIDPKNVKGLYRRACAYKAMNEPERCMQDLKKALQINPHDSSLKKLEKEVRQEQRQKGHSEDS